MQSQLLLCSIVGARPQFIKLAAIIRRLSQGSYLDRIEHRTIHTGQHYDECLSQSLFRDFGLPAPEYELNVGSGKHGQQTGRMLEAIETVLVALKPSGVLVYGDTNSTLAAALAAAKLNIAIYHVEAGLRSYNRCMPEEINRVVADHLSTLLFAPTHTACKNAAAEGIASEKIFFAGDIMHEAFEIYFERKKELPLKSKGKQKLVVTLHRAENTDCLERLKTICSQLIFLSAQYRIKFTVHPRTERVLKEYDLFDSLKSHLELVPPISYCELLNEVRQAVTVVTDSGTLQREAFFLSVPSITLRDDTEWPELIAQGWNQLCKPGQLSQIVAETQLKTCSGLTPPDTDFLVANKPTSAFVLDAILASHAEQGYRAF